MSDYFCGWYFKCQSRTQTLAIIPALHKSGKNISCSIQLITDDGAWNVSLPYSSCNAGRSGIKIDKNVFSKKGIKLCINTPDCSAFGTLRFGELSPIKYDIMGPFKYIPFMECQHSVFSMRHLVNGKLCINGVNYVFNNALGYIEGDKGCSFPKEYAWTQCFFKDGSLMLSVAEIPFGPFSFKGIIGVVNRCGKEYRLATYLGAKAARIRNGEIVIRQGDMTLAVKLIKKRVHPLLAPVSGSMIRTVYESAACRAVYCFKKGEKTLFCFESPNASFEYEYKK